MPRKLFALRKQSPAQSRRLRRLKTKPVGPTSGLALVSSEKYSDHCTVSEPLCLAIAGNNKPCIHPRAAGFLTCRIAEHRDQEASLQSQSRLSIPSQHATSFVLQDYLPRPVPTRSTKPERAGAARLKLQRSLERFAIEASSSSTTGDQDIHISDNYIDPVTQQNT